MGIHLPFFFLGALLLLFLGADFRLFFFLVHLVPFCDEQHFLPKSLLHPIDRLQGLQLGRGPSDLFAVGEQALTDSLEVVLSVRSVQFRQSVRINVSELASPEARPESSEHLSLGLVERLGSGLHALALGVADGCKYIFAFR